MSQETPELVLAASLLTGALQRGKRKNLAALVNGISTDRDLANKAALNNEAWALIGKYRYALANIHWGVGETTFLHYCPKCQWWILSKATMTKCIITQGCDGKLIKASAAKKPPATNT